MRIEGKVVLITGASDGIGAACAEVFRRRGGRLALAARSADALNTIAAAAPDSILTLPGDLCEPEARRRAVRHTLSRYGRIDILINNAGIGLYAPAHQAPAEDTRRMMELNFFAPLDLTQLVAPGMTQQGSGMIVNVSSIAGRMTLPWFTLYSASKSALGALTDGLRVELAGTGIRLMNVLPGYVRTDFQSHVLGGKPPALLGRMKRWAITPVQCAEAIARGVERDARTVVTPWSGWLMLAWSRLAPAHRDAVLGGIYRQQGFGEP